MISLQSCRGACGNDAVTRSLDFANEAKEPQEILDQTEDLILKVQEETNIDNYTLAVTFCKQDLSVTKKAMDR